METRAYLSVLLSVRPPIDRVAGVEAGHVNRGLALSHCLHFSFFFFLMFCNLLFFRLLNLLATRRKHTASYRGRKLHLNMQVHNTRGGSCPATRGEREGGGWLPESGFSACLWGALPSSFLTSYPLPHLPHFFFTVQREWHRWPKTLLLPPSLIRVSFDIFYRKYLKDNNDANFFQSIRSLKDAASSILNKHFYSALSSVLLI